MPGRALPAWHWADLLSVDKAVHAGLFAVLAVLVLLGLRAHAGGAPLSVPAILWAVATCIAYGGLLELMQQLPALGRRGDLNDLLANTAGCGLGWLWDRYRRPKGR
ncbi:MAG: VanZ family protein [Flavobacteriales bacterium]|nr:MAG: VanZ family protein [Flavobacteriales bacterium]